MITNDDDFLLTTTAGQDGTINIEDKHRNSYKSLIEVIKAKGGEGSPTQVGDKAISLACELLGKHAGLLPDCLDEATSALVRTSPPLLFLAIVI